MITANVTYRLTTSRSVEWVAIHLSGFFRMILKWCRWQVYISKTCEKPLNRTKMAERISPSLFSADMCAKKTVRNWKAVNDVKLIKVFNLTTAEIWHNRKSFWPVMFSTYDVDKIRSGWRIPVLCLKFITKFEDVERVHLL